MTPTTASSRAKWRLVTLPPCCPVTARCPECGGQAGGGRQGGDRAARAPPRLHPLGQAQGAARGGLLGPRLLPGDIIVTTVTSFVKYHLGKPIYDEDFTCPFITKQIRRGTDLTT